jgi:uncharacterized protein (DUF1778 family)
MEPAKKRPRGRPMTGRVRIQLKLKPEIFAALTEAAEAEDTTKSEYVETAITERIKRRRK